MSSFPIRTAIYVLWLMAIGTGITVTLSFENSSGSSGAAPGNWPAGTNLTLDSTRDTLIMFAHPRCPCTRASLDELNRLLARCGGHVAAHVLFFKPSGFPVDWTRTDLWRSAAAIPGVTVQDDVDDAFARKFGAETSGYVLLFNPRGQLLFRGGITGSRGHAGDNVGESAIISLGAGQSPGVEQTPVYGCSLLNPSTLAVTTK
ncbi:MAG TPA: hypothetical protein VGI03_03355 [Verrucomicrobiae bacterium]